LLSQGIRLAYQISNFFKETINLHVYLAIPLKTSMVKDLCQCIELLKSIECAYFKKLSTIAESYSQMIQQLSLSLQKLFLQIKGRLESGKKYSEAKLDALAAVNLAIQMLNGCATMERRMVLKVCLHFIMQQDYAREEELDAIIQLLIKLEAIADLAIDLRMATDCSFLFWHRSLIPQYFKDIYQFPQQAQKLQYMFLAFRDIERVFSKVVHEDPSSFSNVYQVELYSAFKQHILDPLCRDIETDLRFHIHAHLAVSERNPWKTGVKDLIRFLRLKPLHFFERTIDIQAYVTHYLDVTFYNLTTVSLNDWKTYGEMRNLAEEKFGLRLTEVHLPGQTLEQGIDALQIMRNIHIFAVRYNYNLNNQVFVEKSSDSKTLNTIGINHIANSIRTHGIGIMNTTVNFIYQFLKQKFVIFSQFLYDDHIKSRLYRDIRFFKENREQLQNRYPMERAQQFNKEIRKLGLTEQKQSFLDQFRMLITEIGTYVLTLSINRISMANAFSLGNAMGYIRMIRSGGFSYIASAIKFVPDLSDIVQFEELVKASKLSSETEAAAR